jgi:hypothetical protein
MFGNLRPRVLGVFLAPTAMFSPEGRTLVLTKRRAAAKQFLGGGVSFGKSGRRS